MKRVVENVAEALDLADWLQKQEGMEGFKIGVVGSYLSEAKVSDSKKVDLVIKARTEEDEELVGSMLVLGAIEEYLGKKYKNKHTVIWLDLLEKDEEALLEFTTEMCIEPNPESAYGSVVEKVRWADDKEQEEEEN